MATTKITITLPDSQLAQIRQRVAEQESSTISGFIQQAVQKSLQSSMELRAVVDEALAATGGPLTAKERAWAKKMLAPQKRTARPAKPRRAA